MRPWLLRSLAGVLAVLFAWFLLALDKPGRPLQEQWGFWALTVGYAVCAVLGPDRAERLIWVAIGGGRDPGPPPPQDT